MGRPTPGSAWSDGWCRIPFVRWVDASAGRFLRDRHLHVLDDHPPPHFHAEYGDDQALLAIADGSVIAGHLPRRALRLVEEWRELHAEELMAAWDLASERENPGTIDPLP